MKALIQKLVDQKVLKTPSIIEAFKAVERKDFVPDSVTREAGIDTALPIGQGQTISQPYTVAFMLEQLQPKPGDIILDVGSGSGWVSCLLANIVGKKGKVYAIERVKELLQFGQNNAKKYGLENLLFIQGDGTKGLAQYAPFDKIHVAAAAAVIPQSLKEQLKVGGQMIIPTEENDIRLIEKLSENKFKEKVFPGFVFVPLIES